MLPPRFNVTLGIVKPKLKLLCEHLSWEDYNIALGCFEVKCWNRLSSRMIVIGRRYALVS